MLGAVPSSFATQMAMATGMGKRQGREESEGMMGRLMLARMKTLEEGFQEVVKEFRSLSRVNTNANSPVDTGGSEQAAPQHRRRKKTHNKDKERPKSQPGLLEVSILGSLKGKEKEDENEGGETTPTGINDESYMNKGNSL